MVFAGTANHLLSVCFVLWASLPEIKIDDDDDYTSQTKTMFVTLYVLEAATTTVSPGGRTTPRPPVPDPVVPVLGHCSSTLLCRDRNSHCVNATCVCLSAFFHDPTTDLCRQ